MEVQGALQENLLIHDEKFSSRIIKKPSLYDICDGFTYRHGLSVMYWPSWRFTKNHHELAESVTVLDRHGRARGLVSPTKPIFYDEK